MDFTDPFHDLGDLVCRVVALDDVVKSAVLERVDGRHHIFLSRYHHDIDIGIETFYFYQNIKASQIAHLVIKQDNIRSFLEMIETKCTAREACDIIIT